MPWSRAIEQDPHYDVYRTLCRLKRERPELREGGLQFLYSDGYTLALARSIDSSAAVAVLGREASERTIRLPLSALGACQPLPGRDGTRNTDLLGAPLRWRPGEEGEILLTLPPDSAVLFAVE